ncbi:MAG: aminotransferase class V-fold PLP-dependent enzyme, partial [Acidimicrobiales bacterium]
MTPLPRSAFAAGRWIYLNHAGFNLLPGPVLEAATACLAGLARDGSLAVAAHQVRAEEVRAAAAALMGVAPGDVAFVKNTTEGLGFVASGLEWAPGDRVVLADRDFP